MPNVVIIDKKVCIMLGRCTALQICDEEEIANMTVNSFATLVQHRMAEWDYNSIKSGEGIQVN
jgi:hypothetical protein